MRKKFVYGGMRVLTALLVMFSVVFGSLIIDNAYAEKTQKKVRVGYFEYSGYHELSADGRYSGYGYDFLKLLQRYTHLNYEFVGYDKSWNDMLRMLLNGEIDMLTSGRKTPEREKLFDYSAPIGVNYSQLMARADDYRFRVHNDDYSSLNGAKIGVLKNTKRISELQKLSDAYNFTYEIAEYGSESELTNALRNGEIDLLADNSLRRYSHEKLVVRFAPENFYVLVRKGDKALLDEVNYGIEQLNQHEENWTDRLYHDNYVAHLQDNAAFSQRELDYISDVQAGNKEIIAVAPVDIKPYAYEKNGQSVGIIPDYFDYLMQKAGLKYKLIISKNFEDYRELSINEKGNLFLACGGYDLERNGSCVTTEAYMNVNIARVMRKDFQGTIKRVAVLRGKKHNFEGNDPRKLERVECSTRREMIGKVESGEADAAYIYNYVVYSYLQEHPDTDLTYVVLNKPVLNLHMHITEQTDHELASILSKCIRADNGHKLDEIMRKQLVADSQRMTLRQLIKHNPHYVVITLLLIAGIGYIAWLNRKMRRSAQQIAEERLAYARSLQDKNEQLQSSMEAEQKANMAKRQFLFNMSHDIRTPMNAILGFAVLAEKELDNREVLADYLSKIRRAGSNLLALINNVLEMSRIEIGKEELHEVYSDTEGLRESVVVSFDAELRRKNMELAFVADVKHRFLLGDVTLIRQVMVNLLSNAIKYTPEGGKIIYKTQELPSDKEGYCRMRTTIIDNGIGISKEFLPHIFDQFEREQTTTMARVEGSGLGMAIVKRLLDLMGGTIRIESELGKGTTVIVETEHRYMENEEVEQESVEDKQQDFTGKRVLLAEDNDLNAEIAVAILQGAGLKVERANNGEQCVEMLDKAPADYYDVVLMDVQMPLMSGYEATQRIRRLKDERKRQVTIIAMTANAFAEDRQKALVSGMDDFLSKPIEIKKLFQLLEKFLNK